MKNLRDTLIHARGYADLHDLMEPWNGKEVFAEIVSAIESREGRKPSFQLTNLTQDGHEKEDGKDGDSEEVEIRTLDGTEGLSDILRTPPTSSGPPDPAILNAPLLGNGLRIPIPAFVAGRDVDTPTPTPRP